ncbi:ABC transporter permease [Gymnodinialimonas sp. 2305UL16-5]|uniref:ABC transporter permease n=1 Tax=Gymnodinialimonas mytili TaxID=3126503 RepID=UPI0030ACF02F
MEQLTWTGSFGAFLNPLLLAALVIFLLGFVANTILALAGLRAGDMEVNADGTLVFKRTPVDYALMTMKYAVLLFLACCVVFVLGGIFQPDIQAKGILGAMAARLVPVWIALIVIFAVSVTFKRKLGLYGKLFDSPIGMAGFGLVMFWIFAAVFSGLIATHGALDVISGLRNDLPGTPLPNPAEGQYPYYLLGGDNLGRDVFSRVVFGAADVLQIAPVATLFAFMVGITLGLPAGYFSGSAFEMRSPGFYITCALAGLAAVIGAISGGLSVGLWTLVAAAVAIGLFLTVKLDTILTFIANLALAFPVILLFFLLVTPEIVAAGVPQYMSMVLFLFPIIFLVVLFNSRFHTQPMTRNILVAAAAIVGFTAYFSLISNRSDADAPIRFWPEALDFFDIPGNLLIVFVAVVFVNSPTVFRIVRGIVLDVKTRDYVAAAQTRGEGPWYIMLWEILPNARGPLIVDFCLRIGYTTILLGTLGFFGLGVSPESPDWGSTINEGRRLLTVYPHPALPPALALMSLVLGLNLLADGLREESLRD